MNDLIPVILESPYAGNVALHVRYAHLCALDSLHRGEAPMVSHLLYTQFLDDSKPDERKLGIDAGLSWRKVAEKSVVYIDFGISRGMEYGIELAKVSGKTIEFRRLPEDVVSKLIVDFPDEQ